MFTFHARREAPRPLDRRGYYRSPITVPGYRIGQAPPNKGRRFPPEPLTAPEVYAMIDACGRGPSGRRNRAIIVLLWRTGLRCAEALALYPKDVDLERGRIAVLHGKGDRSRVVAIDPGASAIVQLWIDERRALGISGRHPLFCVISDPTRGRPLHAAYVRNMIKEMGERAGIEKRVHPHGLRHTYASHLLELGVRIDYIRAMLGHSSMAVTARYADHLNPVQAVEALRGLQWPEAGADSAQAAQLTRASPDRA